MDVLQTLGLTGILVAALAYLSKALLQLWLSKDLDAHRAHLESRAEVQLEQFKAQFQRESTEHAVRFSALHRKQADVLIQLYGQLRDAEQHVKYLSLAATHWSVDAVPDLLTDAGERLSRCVESLLDTFDRNRLYLDGALAGQLDTLISTLREGAWACPSPVVRVLLEKYGGSVDTTAEAKKVKDWWDHNRGGIDLTFRAIETSFRRLLGSEKSGEPPHAAGR